MKPEFWQRLKEIFDQVAALPPAEREDRVRHACGGDPELLEEALAMVAEADRVDESFLDRPVAQSALELLESERDRGRIGQRVGSWRPVKEIGSGGMGVVYLAERAEGGFRQQGALKMVAGLPGKELLRRFADERQMLAQLTHPGIARLLDGGTTDAGVPYLVMEYVEGETITDYCRSRRLTVDERIDLALAICPAVQSAHQKLIIHRDLKPSNILVDAEGKPKLLDFGIAKLLDAASESDGRTVAVALTPEYASPEQLEHRPVSTASDVFSLGVLLYELLTGRRPFGEPGTSMVEISRLMHAGPPTSPSSAVIQVDSNGPIDPQELASERRSSPSRLRRRLKGDLDAIVLKALRFEPGHRYSTVEALAEELRRERDGLPVQARGEALSYRISRFGRRHRVGLVTASLVAFSLLFATVFSVHQARTALRERDKSERVVSALERIFWSPNPDWYASGGTADVTMAAVLESAGEWLPEALAGLPEEEARVRYSLGTTLASLGELEESERELRRAWALHRKVWGDSHVKTAKATAALGGILERRGRHLEAVERFRRVLDICANADCDEFLDYLVPSSQWALGVALAGIGDEAAAEEAMRAGLERRRSQGNGDDALSANILLAMGRLYKNQGRLDEAERLFRQGLGFANSRGRSSMLLNLSDLAKLEGRLSEARGLIEEAREVAVGGVGTRHYFLGVVEAEFAHVELREGAIESAGERIGQALDLMRPALDERSRDLGRALTINGEILLAAGGLSAARSVLERAVDSLNQSVPADSWELSEARSLLGECLVEQGRVTEGLVLLTGAVDSLARRLGKSDPRTRRATARLQEVAPRQSNRLQLGRSLGDWGSVQQA